MLKKISLFVLLILVVVQFFQPNKNTVQNKEQHLKQISDQLKMTPDLFNQIKISCLDCHSNSTKYPWYSKVTPLNFWLNNHIVEGKEHLNFSDWTTYDDDKKEHALEEIIEVIQESEMPLKSYTLVHRNAKLSENTKSDIINWANNQRNK